MLSNYISHIYKSNMIMAQDNFLPVYVHSTNKIFTRLHIFLRQQKAMRYVHHIVKIGYLIRLCLPDSYFNQLFNNVRLYTVKIIITILYYNITVSQVMGNNLPV